MIFCSRCVSRSLLNSFAHPLSLLQVLAYESVLQFAPASSWDGLGMLGNGNPDCISVLLREIPAFGIAALQDSRNNNGGFSKPFRRLAIFVRKQANRVMRALVHGNNHNEEVFPTIPLDHAPEDWREVCNPKV